jgi:hypothetical protein
MCCNIAANGSSFQALAAFNGENSGLDFRIRDAYETDAGMLNLLLLIFARKIIPWLNPILN